MASEEANDREATTPTEVVSSQRRTLPPTPGLPRAPKAPPKPGRETGVADEQADRFMYTDEEMMRLIRVNHDPEKLTNCAAACICREWNQTTERPLPQDIETLFDLLNDVAEDDAAPIVHFIERYCIERREHPHGPWHHGIIRLMSQLLTFSLGDGLRVYMCMKLLMTLSRFEVNLDYLASSGVTPAVLGSISAHPQIISIHESGAAILERIATDTVGPDGIWPPLKETAVDILLLSLEWHAFIVSVIRPVLRALANLAYTLLASAQILSNEPAHAAALHRHLSILDYMRARVPAVADRFITDWPRDLGTQVEGHRLRTFFKRYSEEIDRLFKKMDIAEFIEITQL